MRALFVCLGLLFSLYAQAEVTSPHWPLKQIYTKDAAVMQLRKEALAEVCDQEGCTRFVIADSNAVEAVHDFALLYRWLVNNDDLAPYKGKDGKRFIEVVLAKRKGQCTQTDEEALGRCVLAKLAATYRVVGIIDRMEGGWRKKFPLDLAGEMRKANIIP